jgi:hypothetical protein
MCRVTTGPASPPAGTRTRPNYLLEIALQFTSKYRPSSACQVSETQLTCNGLSRDRTDRSDNCLRPCQARKYDLLPSYRLAWAFNSQTCLFAMCSDPTALQRTHGIRQECHGVTWTQRPGIPKTNKERGLKRAEILTGKNTRTPTQRCSCSSYLVLRFPKARMGAAAAHPSCVSSDILHAAAR